MANLIKLDEALTGISLTSVQKEQLNGFYAPPTDRHGVVAQDRTGEINAKTLGLLRSAVLGNEAARTYHWNEFFKFVAGLMNSLAGSILTAGVVGPTIGLFALGKDPSPYAGHTAYLRDFVWGALITALLIHLNGQLCISGHDRRSVGKAVHCSSRSRSRRSAEACWSFSRECCCKGGPAANLRRSGSAWPRWSDRPDTPEPPGAEPGRPPLVLLEAASFLVVPTH